MKFVVKTGGLLQKRIAIVLPKGGVGKTTTAVNMATALAVMEKKCLLIDCDPSGSCNQLLGFKDKEIEAGLIDVLSYSKSFKQVIKKTELEYLDFIPIHFPDAEAEKRLSFLSSNQLLLHNILDAETHNYEYIVFDTPPYLEGITTLVLAAVESVIIPVKSEGFSFTALERLIRYLGFVKNRYNNQLHVEGILLTMFESHTKASAITEEKIYKNVGKYLFNTIIPKNSSIAESTFYNKPVIFFDAKSKGAKSYLRFAYELIMRNQICPLVLALKEQSLVKLDETPSDKMTLFQNSPNPFSDFTKIKFSVNIKSNYSLAVYSLQEKLIEELYYKILEPGVYEYTWIPKNLASGLFKYKISNGVETEMLKMVFVKK